MTPEEEAQAVEEADRAELGRLARVWQDGYTAGWLDADESPRNEAPNPYTLGGEHVE